MRGVYVLSYPAINDGTYTITKRGFKKKGIRFYLYVALKKIQRNEVKVIVI